MLVAALVILAGVVVVASGRGGEMAPEYPDYPPIDLGPVSAADVALLRPPSAAWGYNMRVTDDALETIAQAVTERDIKISALQQEVADLRAELAQDWTRGSVPPGAAPGDQQALEEEGPGEGPGPDQSPWPFDEEGPAEDGAPGTEAPWPPWAQPEQDGSPAQPTGREITAPQPIVPQSAGPPENSPHPAPAYDDPPRRVRLRRAALRGDLPRAVLPRRAPLRRALLRGVLQRRFRSRRRRAPGLARPR